MIFYLIPILIGFANAFSEDSNQGKLKSSQGWNGWFDELSWQNKNDWEPLFGFYKWSWWPLIIFTDCFHFFKTVWVIAMCFLPLIQVDFEIWTGIFIDRWIAIFCLYSCSFQFFYTLIPYLKLK